MPSYRFECPSCNNSASKVMNSPTGRVVVCKCGTQMNRVPTGPTSRIVETRDNGIMTRAVEQLADVERLSRERARLTEEDFRKP